MATISANGAKGRHQFILSVTDKTAAGTFHDSVTHSLSYTFQLKPVQAGWNWSGHGSGISFSLDIAGTPVVGTIPAYDGSGTVTLQTGTVEYVQTVEGTPSVNLSFSVDDTTGASYTCGDAAGSGAMLLSSQTKAVYTNKIEHWIYGFVNGEGNNSPRNDSYKIGETSFSCKYGAAFTVDAGKAVQIPNGFYLKSMGTSAVSGTWQNYAIGTTVTQQAKEMPLQYYYWANPYRITYDLAGGTNSEANPSTYTVLYGVTLQPPTREGYVFDGWYVGNVPIQGINAGATAQFSDAASLYQALEARTVGDITVTARWRSRGGMCIHTDGAFEKGIARMRTNGIWSVGIPWKRVSGSWKKGG